MLPNPTTELPARNVKAAWGLMQLNRKTNNSFSDYLQMTDVDIMKTCSLLLSLQHS
jgi:hypothetical protein